MDAHTKTRHLPFMQGIADADVVQLQQKDREYGASWKSRGGVGAFMMLARKWDRLENMVKDMRTYVRPAGDLQMAGEHAVTASSYDIFAHAAGSHEERGDAESLLDTIGDLRRYLLLVEAEVIAARPGAMPPGVADRLAGNAPTPQDVIMPELGERLRYGTDDPRAQPRQRIDASREEGQRLYEADVVDQINPDGI